jgi:hypothetical protein
MNDAETITLRATVIGGIRYADDYQVIWRGMSIGRIMRAPGLPPHIPQWRWTSNVPGKPGGGSGSGSDLDEGAVPGGTGDDPRWARGCRHREGASIRRG